MKIPDEIQRGQAVASQRARETINSLRQFAIALNNSSGTKGINIRLGPNGLQIEGDRVINAMLEPCITAKAINDSAEDFSVHDVAGIDDFLFGADPVNNTPQSNFYTQRVISIKLPEAKHFGKVCVCAEDILAGKTGTVYVSGICLANIVRWFAPLYLRQADILAGSKSLLANANGSVDVLWEEQLLGISIAPYLNPHLAIVRLNKQRSGYMLYKNVGSTTVLNFQPLVPPDPSGTWGWQLGDANDQRFGYLILNHPWKDVQSPIYVNCGGDVAPNEIGCCYDCHGPFMARINATNNVSYPYGVRNGVQDFAFGSVGLIARENCIGNKDNILYGILQKDDSAVLVQATSNPSGNTQNVQVCKSDGTLSGVDLLVDVIS